MLSGRGGRWTVSFFQCRNRSLNLSNIIIEPHKEEETLEKAVEDADESNPAVDEEEEEEPE